MIIYYTVNIYNFEILYKICVKWEKLNFDESIENIIIPI